jgi:F0F1-type ATP synthase assembly protein I
MNILKHISRTMLKEDFRKLGVNFITAGIVGAFITHWTDLSAKSAIILMLITILGLMFLLVGCYKKEAKANV